MTTFRFSIEEGGNAEHSEVELVDLDAARTHASQLLCNLMGDAHGALWREPECRVSVSDHAGLLLLQITAFAVEAPALMRS